MSHDLTQGSIVKSMLLFALPIMIGNILQQFYNIADTMIVGRFLGGEALAAVGTAYTLMVFLTSVFIGLCMGSGAFIAIQYGNKNMKRLREGVYIAFMTILSFTLFLNALVYLIMEQIFRFLNVPGDVELLLREYLVIIFAGLSATFLYNFIANILRAMGNSVIPLLFLAASAILNIVLDILFVLFIKAGVAGAAAATVISQYAAAIGIAVYYYIHCPKLRIQRADMRWDKGIIKEISSLSVLTCLQQSVMNFGILMVQGLVNSFGTAVMAAFTTAVKIDSFAYAPVQDFGNAFSTFIAQNYGAKKEERIRKGIKVAGTTSVSFCLSISLLVCTFAEALMRIFVKAQEQQVIAIGIGYLRIEGACYVGIGILFLLYGYYRAIEKPGMSLLLTIISLGIRVVLAYVLSAIPILGVTGIWLAIPIGWAIADIVGITYLRKGMNKC